MRARKGITIVYPRKLKERDGTKRQVVDYIPPDRNAIVIWQDQFGSVHATSMGDIDNRKPKFDRLVERAASEYGLFAEYIED